MSWQLSNICSYYIVPFFTICIFYSYYIVPFFTICTSITFLSFIILIAFTFLLCYFPERLSLHHDSYPTFTPITLCLSLQSVFLTPITLCLSLQSVCTSVPSLSLSSYFCHNSYHNNVYSYYIVSFFKSVFPSFPKMFTPITLCFSLKSVNVMHYSIIFYLFLICIAVDYCPHAAINVIT